MPQLTMLELPMNLTLPLFQRKQIQLRVYPLPIPSELIETAFAARTDSECRIEAGFNFGAFSYMPKLCQQKIFPFGNARNVKDTASDSSATAQVFGQIPLRPARVDSWSARFVLPGLSWRREFPLHETPRGRHRLPSRRRFRKTSCPDF